MTDELLHAIRSAVKETVNGKIDTLTKKLDEHIERVEPIIAAYEEEKALNAATQRIGDKAIFFGKVIGAIGVIAGAGLYTLNKINQHLP